MAVHFLFTIKLLGGEHMQYMFVLFWGLRHSSCHERLWYLLLDKFVIAMVNSWFRPSCKTSLKEILLTNYKWLFAAYIYFYSFSSPSDFSEADALTEVQCCKSRNLFSLILNMCIWTIHFFSRRTRTEDNISVLNTKD